MARTAVVIITATLTAAAVAAGASAPAPDRSPSLFVVSTDGEPAEALARTDARVIARYGAFTLVEARDDDARRLQRAGADRRDDMRKVAVARGTLDPARERPALSSKRRRPVRTGLALVQFVGPVKDAWLERVRDSGVRVVTYMAQNAYLVHGSARQLARLGAAVGTDPAVRAVVPYRASDKLDRGVKGGGRQRLAVQTLSGGDGAAARRALARRGRRLRASAGVGPFLTQYVEADAAGAAALARDPGVVSVEPAPEPELYDEIQAQALADNLNGGNPLVPAAPGYFAFHEGLELGAATFPFAVDVTDEGIDAGTVGTSHPDLHEGGLLASPSRIAYADEFGDDSDARDCGGHGTINAGIVGGFNTGTGSAFEDASGFNYDLGIAPRVRLGASKIFLCSGDFDLNTTFSALTMNAYTKGARISSNSWGSDVDGGYDPQSQEYDSLVRDANPGLAGNQEMVEVFAAGNEGDAPGVATRAGSIGSPGTGKNVITVGAAEGVRASGTDGCGITNSGADDARDVIGFSSRGPTDDGRRKPEIVGPGTHIVGAAPQHAGYTGGGVCNQFFPSGQTLYSLSSGTSHSTPAIAGMAALVREWYRQKKGGGSSVPSPALTKAILAGAASDLVGGADGGGGTNENVPNQVQGWGLGNLRRALDTGPRYFRDQQDLLAGSGASFSRSFTVQDPSKPVRVTLAWTDAPGPTSGNAFVNDLNLTVEGGDTFKGNVLAGGRSVPGGAADFRNNLESVYLPAGASGTFSVEVVAAAIGGNGVPGNGDSTDQDFALTVSNASEVALPAFAKRATGVTESGDLDGAVEPGEGFSLAQQLKNTGAAAGTGVSGTLTAPSSATISDGTAAWPDLAPGTTAANSDGLAGSLKSAAVCGAPVQLSLDITSAEGATSTIPVTVETGAAAAAVGRDSSDVPKTIPDGSAAGVTSTLEVGASGRIKDVNVRLASLTHTWVGDLKIDLIAPGGTTVNLVSHPGGPDNGGNNFTGTVLDDEAATAIGATGTSAPYTGSFKPQSDQLSRLDGEEQQGTWRLRVADLFPADTGILVSWGHDVSPADCGGAGGPSPSSISNLTATGGVESVALDWDDAGAATGYKVFRRDPDGSYPPNSSPTAAPSTSDYTDTGRTPGAQYCYRVRAVNEGGEGPLSDESCATPTGLPPGPITSLGAAAGVESVALDWDDTPTATQYFVFRRNPDQSYPVLPTATVATSQHTDTGRTPDVEECYRVQATNSWGTGPLSGEVCATPTFAPVGGISGLSATGGVESVALDWADTVGASGYEVFRRDPGGSYPATPTASPGSSQYTDTGRTAGTLYCYKVRAIGPGGPGPLSGEACATPTAPGSGSGGGSDGGGGGGDAGGGEPELPILPILDLSGTKGTVQVDSRGRFTLAFRGTGRATGSLTLTSVKAFAAARKKRRLTLSRRRFTAPASGQIKLRLKLSKRNLRVLKRARRIRTRLAVKLGERSAAKTLTLKAPRTKKRRR